MSTELTNTSKLREFVEELKRLNVEIINPSINNCYAEFKAIDGKIYYGLGAIKNVGFEAISNIVKERENHGKFKSFFDFISRVHSKDVNKLQLEGLTKAGAFDEFENERSKIFVSIPKIISTIKNINDDKISNQSNLFEHDDSSKKAFEFLPSKIWSQKELLTEEFKSVGFYISNHPLNEYSDFFKELKIVSFETFCNHEMNEGLVAGTIMSIQEKKSAKGTPYAIIKFSDQQGEFELFLFSDMLVNNRDKLIESESFILTLQKDKISNESVKKRINIKKILSVNQVISKPYTKVTIELKENYKINEIKEILSKGGDTEINLVVKSKDKLARYLLQNNREFDFNHLKALKAKKYVTKITV